MDDIGLYLNDLSLHGHGRDMVMAGWQHNSRFVTNYLLIPVIKLLFVVLTNYLCLEQTRRSVREG